MHGPLNVKFGNSLFTQFRFNPNVLAKYIYVLFCHIYRSHTHHHPLQNVAQTFGGEIHSTNALRPILPESSQ